MKKVMLLAIAVLVVSTGLSKAKADPWTATAVGVVGVSTSAGISATTAIEDNQKAAEICSRISDPDAQFLILHASEIQTTKLDQPVFERVHSIIYEAANAAKIFLSEDKTILMARQCLGK